MKPHSEVSHRKFAERLERQANDGHHWDQVPEMLREAAKRIRELDNSNTVYARAVVAQIDLSRGPITRLIDKAPHR